MQHQQKKRRQSKSPNSRRCLPALIMLLLAVSPFSCSDAPKPKAPSAPASTPVQKQAIASAPTPTATTVIEQKPADIYVYAPAGRRDPFAPIIERETKKSKRGDSPPLERYNIGEFKLTGIVWGGFGYNAVLEGPDGKGDFVRTGTVIGMNRGVVKKITPNRMIIEEKYKTYTGEVERKEIIVELRKKKEETR